MMAGAAPNKTRQLLDRSLIQKSSSRGLICGKDDRMVLTGEREHAIGKKISKISRNCTTLNFFNQKFREIMRFLKNSYSTGSSNTPTN